MLIELIHFINEYRVKSINNSNLYNIPTITNKYTVSNLALNKKINKINICSFLT